MRQDGDFAAYVAARWPSLVRSLVLLGCPVQLAPDVALSALGRCGAHWGDEGENVDVVVHRALLDAWAARCRTAWWDTVPHDPEASMMPPELVRELDLLPRDDRAALVLHGFAGLGESQIDRVLDGPVRPPRSPDHDELRRAAEGLPVPLPPSRDVVLARGRGERTRRTGRVLVPLVVAVLLLGSVAWWSTRPGPVEPTDLGPAPAVRAENPAAVAWYGNGALHLEHAVIELPSVRDVVPLRTSAVYGDDSGRVVLVAEDGTRTLIGHKDPEVPVLASDETGWAAWVEPDEAPVLVVWRLDTGETIARRRLQPSVDPQDVRPLAIDLRWVYVRDGGGVFRWNPPDGRTEAEPAQLVDVASGTQVVQLSAASFRVTQPFFDASFDLPGNDPRLSPDGNYVLSRTIDLDTGRQKARLFDTRTGSELPTGLTPADVVLDAVPGGEGAATYILTAAGRRSRANGSQPSSAEDALELRGCTLQTTEVKVATCLTLVTFADRGAAPVLGR